MVAKEKSFTISHHDEWVLNESTHDKHVTRHLRFKLLTNYKFRYIKIKIKDLNDTLTRKPLSRRRRRRRRVINAESQVKYKYAPPMKKVPSLSRER